VSRTRWLLFAVATAGYLAATACVPGELFLESGRDAGPDAKVDASKDARVVDAPTDGGVDMQIADAGPDVSVDTSHACTGPADCPKGEACDTMTGLCSTSCAKGQLCNGGCCQLVGTTGGACVTGTLSMACGSTGALCDDCDGFGKGPDGGVCLPTGHCSCAKRPDCPRYEACEMGSCTTSCSAAGECNQGCCDGTQCQPGDTPSACGAGGLECSTCGGAKPLCSGACVQCASEKDCMTGQACNAHVCTTTCAVGVSCNGGCCNTSDTTPMCVSGVSDEVCGSTGAECTDCLALGDVCTAGTCAP
jgi:hypothetical protein